MSAGAPSAGGAPTSSRPGGRARVWLDERVGLGTLAEALAGGVVPGGASVWRALGWVAAALVAVEAATGVLLATAYAPAVNTAWASVAYIQDQMPLGWFVRGVHSFGSSALILVAGLHLGRVLVSGAYRRPREMNWVIGLGLLGLCLLLAMSGTLLPWDQKGYWTKQVEATIVGGVPLVGGAVQRLLQGGIELGNLTLTRAYAAHAIVLPALLVGLIVLHVWLHRRHGPTPPWTLSPDASAARAAPFWPDQAVRNTALGTLALGLVTAAAISRHGVPLDAPADPASTFLARPEWYALPLYELRLCLEGPLELLATVVIPTAVLGLLVGLPFLDRSIGAAPSGRARVLAAAGVGIAAAAALAAIALVKDARDPAVGKARAAEQALADRARHLARSGVPPEGGRAVYRNDPLFHARELWDERCAGCHGTDGTGGEKAPDLHAYNSRAWIRGFLQDPGGRLYMGPAKLEKGMRPVEATREELDALAEVIYAESGARDVDAARAARGHDLLGQKNCDTCHDFDGSGENEGPNLKGRGTLPWVAGVISDAGHGVLFGPRNQMPSFASKLTPAEIDELARFVIALRN